MLAPVSRCPHFAGSFEFGLPVAPAGKLVAVPCGQPECEGHNLIPQLGRSTVQPEGWHWLAAGHRFALRNPAMPGIALNYLQ
jgi:hypothetical protein